MILTEIKRYLIEREQASLADMAVHFDSHHAAMRGMLEVWLRKGSVTMLYANASCGSRCQKCDISSVEIYQWIEEQGSQTRPLLFGALNKTVC
jgi:hypothetical protein